MAGGSTGALSRSMVSAVSPLTGILGMVELGAQSIVYELAVVVFMVSVQDWLCGGARYVSGKSLRTSIGIYNIQPQFVK